MNSNLPAIWQAGISTRRPDESRKSGAAVRGFIDYLKKPARHPAGGYEERKVVNPEP